MTALQKSTQYQLRQFIEQIERLEEEKAASAADIRDKYLEAKALGFDPKIMRKVISLRRKSKTEREEDAAVLATYLHALGMEGTPLGDWGAQQDEAADRLRAMAREDGAETEPTISINGGPAHPMSVVKEAVQLVKKARASA